MTWKSTLSWDNAKKRAQILQRIRRFFDSRGVIEVETPLLSKGTVTDVHLDAFSCEYGFLKNSCDATPQNFFLQTSPEFAMKRLLASGYQSIYQICKSFRDEGYGQHHNPEFTMLEWYRVGFDHFDLINEISLLLKETLNCLEPSLISYQQVFIDYIDLDPLETSIEELLHVIKYNNKLSDWLEIEKDIDTLLQFIFAELIEPSIGKERPCFVFDFPKSQASLAKISAKDPRVADRFECYFHGIELANGFNELTDAKEQNQRFKEDNAKRNLMERKEIPIDINFINALDSGLPACAGVALGVDRLIMLAINSNSIEDVISFPIENA